MPFQFYCPHGHLLQGDESQVGQQCTCPYCQSEFLMPSPTGGAIGAGNPGFGPGPPYERYGGYGQSGQPEVEYDEAPPLGAADERPDAADFFGLPGRNEPVDAEKEEEEEEEEEHYSLDDDDEGEPSGPPVDLFEKPKATQQDVLHSPCPKGHILETPRDMLGQEVICPFCEAEFVLRLDDTIEARREKAEKEARREKRLAKVWMNWAIAAAVVVGLGVLAMIVLISSSR